MNLVLSIILYALITTWSANLNADVKKPAPWVGESLGGAICKGNPQGYGPYDYLNRANLQISLETVEAAHFTPKVESLRGGNTSIDALGDLDYTLRAWPNHHRALHSIIRFQQINARRMREWGTPPECYLQRAAYFSPKDANVHLLYGIYLHKLGGQEAAAIEHYKLAMELDPINPQIKYNLALLYVDTEDWEEARLLAKELYGSSFPLKGLRNKLERAGQWE